MHRTKTIALALIGIGLFTVACSSGSANDSTGASTSAASGTPVQTASPSPSVNVAAVQATVNDSLPTLADFPAGWTQSPKDPNEPKLGLTGNCAVLEADGLPGQIAGATSDDFKGPLGQDVTAATSIFPDDASGQDAFDSYVETTSSCRDELTSAYSKALQDAFVARGVPLGAIQDIRASLAPTTSPGVGDASASFRLLTTMTAQGQTMQFVTDLLLFRDNGVLGSVSYYVKGDPDLNEELAIATALLAKINGFIRGGSAPKDGA